MPATDDTRQHYFPYIDGLRALAVLSVIAYHLDKTRFMHGFLRMLYFLPFMTSAVAMAWVWPLSKAAW